MTVHTLFNFAKARRYLPKDHDEIESVAVVKDRKWEMVMDELARRGQASGRLRYDRAWKGPTFIGLRSKKIIDTTPDDRRAVLADDKSSTKHFLRRLQNLAIGLGRLPWPLIPPKIFTHDVGFWTRAVTEPQELTSTPAVPCESFPQVCKRRSKSEEGGARWHGRRPHPTNRIGA